MWALVLALLAADPALTRPPELEHAVEPVYPEAARAAGRTGTVVLRLDLDAAGLVSAVEVVESAAPDLDAAAITAARGLRFRPAEVDGVPAPVRILYRYAFTLAELPQEPVVNLAGVVLLAAAPLARVRVELVDLGVATESDSEGRFAFADVPAGTHVLRLSGSGLETLTTEQVVREGVRADLRLAMERARDADVDEEEVVRAARVQKQAVETRIEAQRARRVAGTQGDTVQIVHSLPGVGRAAAGSGEVTVWGAAPGDTRTYVDGVLVPRLFHLGGVRASVGSELVGSVELVPGGWDAAYGRAVGGLLRVETAAPAPAEGVHANVAADVLDGSAAVRARLAPALGVAVSGRYGWLEHTLGSALAPEDRLLLTLPAYWDAQAKVAWTPRTGETLALLALASGDAVERGTPSPDPGERRVEREELEYQRVALRWERVLDDGATLGALAWIGRDGQRTRAQFGEVPASVAAGTWRGAVRAWQRTAVTSALALRAGVDLELGSAALERSGALTVPPREGDPTPFGLPPGDRVNADAWDVRVAGAGAYTVAELALFDGVVGFEPGLRLDGVLVDGDHLVPAGPGEPEVGYSSLVWLLEPRALAWCKPASWLTLRAASGLYHQPPDPADLSPVFGNPRLGVASGAHLVAGAAAVLGDATTLELTGFHTRTWELATRAPLPSPLVAQVLLAEGAGRSFGAQLVLKQRVWRGLDGWLSYTLLRAERRDTAGAEWRPFDGDQTHVLAAVASWDLGAGFDAGARLRWATGTPRTPVVDAYYDARADTWAPLYGEHNAGRLPDFVQLDVRLAWTWRLGDAMVSAFVDVQNVTNRTNPEEVVYTSDFRSQGFIAGLPVLPVLGVRGEL